MQNILESLTLAQENYAGSYMGILRYAVPVLSAILLLRCVLPLLTFRREPEIWAWLNMTDGSQIPITHWENVIGRSKSSDVTIDFPTVSRNHAVLTGTTTAAGRSRTPVPRTERWSTAGRFKFAR